MIIKATRVSFTPFKVGKATLTPNSERVIESQRVIYGAWDSGKKGPYGKKRRDCTVERGRRRSQKTKCFRAWNSEGNFPPEKYYWATTTGAVRETAGGDFWEKKLCSFIFHLLEAGRANKGWPRGERTLLFGMFFFFLIFGNAELCTAYVSQREAMMFYGDLLLPDRWTWKFGVTAWSWVS